MLSIRNLEVVYHSVVLVLRGVSLEVPNGAIVALLGPNGAGKTTALRAVSGLLSIHEGRITKGDIELEGDSIARETCPRIVRRGLAQVMEGRRIFPALSVEENLRIGAFTRRRDPTDVDARIERVLDRFPTLGSRLSTRAGELSGGQQQMLAIAKGLVLDPDVLLVDELTLGLAPSIVQNVVQVIGSLQAQGLTMIIVEQSLDVAAALAPRSLFLEKGRIRFDGPTAELTARDDLARAVFLGGSR